MTTWKTDGLGRLGLVACVLSLCAACSPPTVSAAVDLETDPTIMDLQQRLEALESAPADVMGEEVAGLTAEVDRLVTAVSTLTTDAELAAGARGALEDRFVVADTTWIVGASDQADFAHPADAWAAAKQRVIVGSATLTLDVEDGSYAFGDAWVIDHPQGTQVRVVGNPAAPTAVQFTFPGDGLVVDGAFELGLLDSVKLAGGGAGAAALSALNGGAIHTTDVTIEGFETAIQALRGSLVRARGATLIGGNSFAYHGSVLDLGQASIVGAGLDAVDVRYGSALLAYDAAVSGAGRHGILVDGGASVSAEGLQVSGATNYGVAVQGSYASLTSASLLANGTGGISIGDNGVAVFGGATLNDNVLYPVRLWMGGIGRGGASTTMEGNGAAASPAVNQLSDEGAFWE